MIVRIPISNIKQLASLDEAEMLDGYLDGLNNEPCGDNRSASYWHGWRNGMADKGYMKGDEAQRLLAQNVVESGYLARTRDSDDA